MKQEYEDIVKNEVQRAISADEDAIGKLCGNYIDNVKAYTQKEKVRNKYTGLYEEPDERLMRVDRGEDRHPRQPQGRLPPRDHELHRRAGARGQDVRLPDQRAAAQGAGAEAVRGPEGHIKLKNLVSCVVDKETQEKIDLVKDRLIKNYGYCEICATDVLNFVASIFARGDAKE